MTGQRRAPGKLACWLLLAVLWGAGAGAGERRDFIHIVGDREIYRLVSVVAEWFAESTPHKYPLMEATGVGAGLALFCRGVGEDTPDLLMLDRPLSPTESAHCADRGVDTMVELLLGHRAGGQRGRLPVYLYLKPDHLRLVPGLWAFTGELLAAHTIGQAGYLRLLGLEPLSARARQRQRRLVARMVPPDPVVR